MNIQTHAQGCHLQESQAETTQMPSTSGMEKEMVYSHNTKQVMVCSNMTPNRNSTQDKQNSHTKW